MRTKVQRSRNGGREGSMARFQELFHRSPRPKGSIHSAQRKFLVQPVSPKWFVPWLLVRLVGLVGVLLLASVVLAEPPADEPTPPDTPPFPAMPPSLPPLRAELLNRVTDSQPLPVLP